MKIEQIKTDLLVPYKLNAKQHPQSQIEGIAESIRRFGFTQPIVVNKQNEIIIGHGRFEAAKIVGLEKIPCLRLDALSEQEVKALRLLDNRIAETGWDVELLKMDFEGFDFDLQPFNTDFNFVTDIMSPEQKDRQGAKEISSDEFNEFANTCPKCGFEFGEKEKDDE
jgi:ParB-like chromosome segregation protein Spo0J